MSKRKTRQEKIISDLHRKLHAQSQSSSSPSRHVSTQSSTYSYKARSMTSTPHTPAVTTNISYIKHDLLKTTIVTSAIIVAQLVLFYLLRSHVLMIPMVRY